jgi:ring-1,2-phenylacetyl-CoA epoxidase subunit PaaD
MVTARPAAYDIAAATPDPELPMLTVADLGILRSVEDTGDGVVVTITPTYSGCPAMHEISADLRHRLERAGFAGVTVRTQLAPPWTTDWITPDGRRKLAQAGIAPPPAVPPGHHGTTFGSFSGPSDARSSRTGPVPLTLGPRPSPACPRCGSADTVAIAEFGATACKSLHRCAACGEPFEGVKAL